MTVLNPRPSPALEHSGVTLPQVDRIEHLPILILFPHSRCNCRCVMCDIWRGTGRDELSVSEVSRWAEEWQALGVRRVVLSGGEALLHSDLWALCDVLRGAGIGISVLTTGLLLHRHAEALASRCDDVVASLDGPARIHDAIRNVPRAFERLKDGVAALRAINPDIAVSARCTVQRRNYSALRETVAAARELQVDRVSFLAVDVSSSAFNRPEGWNGSRVEDVLVPRSELPVLAAELAALERDHSEEFSSGFISESPQKLRQRLLQYFMAAHGEGEFHPNQCNAPWVSTVIESDGTVRPCFFQPALGNIRRSASLDAVINSPEAIAWRAGLDVTRNEICRKCVCTLSLQTPAR